MAKMFCTLSKLSIIGLGVNKRNVIISIEVNDLVISFIHY